MIKANGHESVLEHASAGFSIVTDRGVTHEIVRHRLASYSQESTRYCNYGKAGFGGEISVIEPRGALRENTEQREVWVQAICAAERGYLSMLENGTSPQIARSVLPNSLKSEIGMTANFREWRHFLRLRTSPKAHPQMREIAEMLRRQLLAISKVCFEDIP
jgi:thymidylate synthase (FAD)